jgi:hypothetical protein
MRDLSEVKRTRLPIASDPVNTPNRQPSDSLEPGNAIASPPVPGEV